MNRQGRFGPFAAVAGPCLGPCPAMAQNVNCPSHMAFFFAASATSFILRPSNSGSRNLAASSKIRLFVTTSCFLDWMTKRQVL